MGAAIVASNADMEALDGWNSQTDQTFREVRVVLQVIIGPLTTHREVGTC